MKKKVKVLLGPSSFAAQNKIPLQKLIDAGCEVIDNPFKRKLTKDETISLLGKDVLGLIAGLETLDRDVMTSTGIKVISRCGSGMSNVDMESAKELGIAVYNTPDAPTNAVAELTIGMMLALLRKIPQASQALHNKKWEKQLGCEAREKTLLVIGLGRIGKRVAELAQAFGCRVIAHDPFAHQENSAITLLPLNEALKQADIVTLHASGAIQLLGTNEFALMKKGSYLLNVSRGELIDETALFNALQSGYLAGAAIDAFKQEPYTGDFCQLPQVILTPHIGSYTEECRLNMECEAADNLLAGIKTAAL